jgi:hypothetical protein
MKLQAWEVSLQLTKGILLGVQELEFIEEDVYEKDIEIHFPLFKIIITLIYN